MVRFISHVSSVNLSFIVCVVCVCEFSRMCMYCTNSISENPWRCCNRSDRNIPPLLSSTKSLHRHFNNVGVCRTNWIHTVWCILNKKTPISFVARAKKKDVRIYVILQQIQIFFDIYRIVPAAESGTIHRNFLKILCRPHNGTMDRYIAIYDQYRVGKIEFHKLRLPP